MKEITKVILENEMDLILAHKQTMKLAELIGLSLAAQTTFATAVSEVSRSIIGKNNQTSLTLYVSNHREKSKFLTAVLDDSRLNFAAHEGEGYKYAKRLVSTIKSSTSDKSTQIELSYQLPIQARLDDQLAERWIIQLNTDPTVSPYEEIKRKNRQLIEMADKLRESEQQYKSLTDSLPIMIFTVDKEGAIEYANQWVTKYTGTSFDQINLDNWRSLLHPEDNVSSWKTWQEHNQVPTAVIIPEHRLKDANTGEYRWHTGVSTPITEEDGTIKSWNTFLVDIHAQKLIEQTLKDNIELKNMAARLEENIALLNQSNQQLEQFAYVASHDLQEPLRKISFYSDLLNKRYSKGLPEEASWYYNNLMNAADRMRNLIKDILKYSTVQRENFTTVDLNSIVAETLKDLEIAVKEKDASIVVCELPAIEGNARQLKQLFENILSNALKFNKPHEKPAISITADLSGDRVIIYFNDEGIGFDEQYGNKMFDLFQQLNSKEKYKGTGIGLALCKKIVHLHNGSLTAKSTPGDGATFIVELPLHR